MPTPNQVFKSLRHEVIAQEDLLAFQRGSITEAGLRQNIRIGILYIEAWLRGVGCVPLFNLMEDAATAEISRAQIWQWIHHHASLSDGRVVSEALVRSFMADEMVALRENVSVSGRLEEAADIFAQVALADHFEDFLTIPAYRKLLSLENTQF